MNSAEHRELLKSFYKYQSWIFLIFGVWKLPDTTSQRLLKMYDKYFYFILIFWIISYNANLLIYFIQNINKLNEITKIIFVFASTLTVFVKFVNIKRKNGLYLELVETLQQPTYRPRNSREVKLFKQSQKLCQFIRNIYGVILVSILHVTLLPYLFFNSWELPLPMYTPMEINTKIRYIIMYLYQYCAISIFCYMNIGFESISASFLIYIRGQLDILCDRLEHLGWNCEVIDDRNITQQLRACIEYHTQILRITKVVENLMSLPMTVQVAMSVMVANFYVVFHQSGTELGKTLIYQVCMLTQVCILCYFPNEVTSKSQEIPHFLYSSNWFKWNKFNRKLILLMMNRFDLPIRIRSINWSYNFNLAAFTAILNSIYRYFTLLRRINM